MDLRRLPAPLLLIAVIPAMCARAAAKGEGEFAVSRRTERNVDLGVEVKMPFFICDENEITVEMNDHTPLLNIARTRLALSHSAGTPLALGSHSAYIPRWYSARTRLSARTPLALRSHSLRSHSALWGTS